MTATTPRLALAGALLLALAGPMAAPAAAKVANGSPNAVLPTPGGRVALPATPCASAREAVAREGALVLTTGPHTYDRFVRDQSYCSIGQTTEPAFSRAADAAACFVGYRCKGDEEGKQRD